VLRTQWSLRSVSRFSFGYASCTALSRGRFVQTRPLIGLNQAAADRCIELLNSAPHVEESWWASVYGESKGRAETKMLTATSLSAMPDMPQQYATPQKKAPDSEHSLGSPPGTTLPRPRTAPSKRPLAAAPFSAGKLSGASKVAEPMSPPSPSGVQTLRRRVMAPP
jgi:hypothetical protein